MNINEQVSKIIKILRAKYNLTQEEIAFRCNMQPGHFSQLENAGHKPYLETVNKIANAFNMSIVDFLAINEDFLRTPDIDPMTFKLMSISNNLSEQDRLHLLNIAKTFTKK